MSDLHELDLVRWIATRAPEVGDDCAVLACEPWGDLLVTTDSVIDGVHLHWSEHGPDAFGYKAVARNLSDIAAMGGEPLWAVIAAVLPRGATRAEAEALYKGAERAGCRLVGGDTSFGPTAMVNATVLGRAPERGTVLRSGARPGDAILVTGSFGRSLPTGHHATFTPRLTEAAALLATGGLGAMIDVSDGLSTDLWHILEASGHGARLEAAAIPRRDNATLEEALNDGEDYELLATVLSPTGRTDGDVSWPAGFTRIGTITDGPGAVVVDGHGNERALVRGGFEHRA